MPNLGIEHADCAVVQGNEFTISTFNYANKPIYKVPTSADILLPWPAHKDFEACKKCFLWLGSGGLVHKGLDLLLDVFAEMPDYQLTICGPISREKDFEKTYYRELYQTSNIHTVGWIDISSQEFIRITNSCIGFINPSCSEGQSASVVTCLHAGLIGIVTYESGVDIGDDFGIVLKECSIEEIKDSIRRISGLPDLELKRMSRKAWKFARTNHTREKFAEEYRKVILEIIAETQTRTNNRYD